LVRLSLNVSISIQWPLFSDSGPNLNWTLISKNFWSHNDFSLEARAFTILVEIAVIVTIEGVMRGVAEGVLT
ncbi:MAG: hypothetical protein U9R25_04340, partial [Chloroflexota bacterium]|nr:hypothetical protein [Chloroflexota bacterium]